MNLRHIESGSDADDTSRKLNDLRAERIQAIMDARGIKNVDLANATGLSRQKITRITSGKNQNANDLCLVADALGASLDYLCGTAVGEKDTTHRQAYKKFYEISEGSQQIILDMIELLHHTEIQAAQRDVG